MNRRSKVILGQLRSFEESVRKESELQQSAQWRVNIRQKWDCFQVLSSFRGGFNQSIMALNT